MGLPAERKQLLLPTVLGEATKADIAKEFSSLTLERVAENKYPSLTRIKHDQGVDKPGRALAILIIEASTSFGDEVLDKDTALEVAYEVISNVGMLSLEDCYVCLREMKSEKQFGKLNANKVLVKFKDYAERKMAHHERMSISKHMANKHPDNANRSSGNQREAYRQFRDQYVNDPKISEYQTNEKPTANAKRKK
ncbi:MAG: hypothetical protein EP346_06915 [Bacteroidetes bacterium]|nr:MAG: hypothetical protein EP346_06915 [Bacteroidota bacterium]